MSRLERSPPVLPVILSVAKDDRPKGEYMHEEGEAGNAGRVLMCRVIADYEASFPDPIEVRAGEVFDISEKIDYWKGNPNWAWIWCTDARGKSGWVPKNYIDFQAPSGPGAGTALYDYAARELSASTGEELVIEQEESGWFWCVNVQEQGGWIPAEHVTV